MRTVQRFELARCKDERSLILPSNFKILRIGEPYRVPYPHVWIEVDSDNPSTEIIINSYRTCQEVKDGTYMGSCDELHYYWRNA